MRDLNLAQMSERRADGECRWTLGFQDAHGEEVGAIDVNLRTVAPGTGKYLLLCSLNASQSSGESINALWNSLRRCFIGINGKHQGVLLDEVEVNEERLRDLVSTYVYPVTVSGSYSTNGSCE